MPRRVGLLASALLYAASLVLPAGKDDGPPRTGLEYLASGGPMFAGCLLVPANACFLVGWGGLAAGRRAAPVAGGLVALAVAVAGVPPLAAVGVLAYPAYWVWLASFVVLAVAGVTARRPARHPTPAPGS